MPATYNNKIVYGGKVLIDLTADTASADTVLKGQTFHDKTGATVTGTCSYDSDTQDATVSVAEILKGKTAYARGTKLTGTMPNNGAVNGEITSLDIDYTVPQGYHDGSGKVGISAVEKAKIAANNIREGITILGVTGTMSGSESVKAQSKEVTSSTAQQIITPDKGFNYLSQVTIKPIPYVESQNSAGGITVTIG